MQWTLFGIPNLRLDRRKMEVIRIFFYELFLGPDMRNYFKILDGFASVINGMIILMNNCSAIHATAFVINEHHIQNVTELLQVVEVQRSIKFSC